MMTLMIDDCIRLMRSSNDTNIEVDTFKKASAKMA